MRKSRMEKKIKRMEKEITALQCGLVMAEAHIDRLDPKKGKTIVFRRWNGGPLEQMEDLFEPKDGDGE